MEVLVVHCLRGHLAAWSIILIPPAMIDWLFWLGGSIDGGCIRFALQFSNDIQVGGFWCAMQRHGIVKMNWLSPGFWLQSEWPRSFANHITTSAIPFNCIIPHVSMPCITSIPSFDRNPPVRPISQRMLNGVKASSSTCLRASWFKWGSKAVWVQIALQLTNTVSWLLPQHRYFLTSKPFTLLQKLGVWSPHFYSLYLYHEQHLLRKLVVPAITFASPCQCCLFPYKKIENLHVAVPMRCLLLTPVITKQEDQ